MTKTGLLLIAAAAATTAASNLALRGGVQRAGGFGVSERGILGDLPLLLAEPLFVAGVLMYGVAALIWFRVLSSEVLAESYVLLVGLTFVLVTAGAVIAFKESMNAVKFIGMALTLGGIAIVGLA